MIKNAYLFAKNKDVKNYSNRGMNLENDINLSNEYYRACNIAYIYMIVLSCWLLVS